MSKIRNTIKLNYKGADKDLKITFDVIDRCSAFVDWASIVVRISEGKLPLTDIAKFVWFCMNEAGHKVDIDDVYDEIGESQENAASYRDLCIELYAAFVPQGKKKAIKSEQAQEKQ